MIVGDIKPVEEIVASISEYKNILLMGCGACVSVSLSGGDREAVMLAAELGRKVHWGREKPPRITTETIMRQCELDMIQAYHRIPKGTQAILSLACGAGVQQLWSLDNASSISYNTGRLPNEKYRIKGNMARPKKSATRTERRDCRGNHVIDVEYGNLLK